MSNRLYDKMQSSGLAAEIVPVYNTTHELINKNFGKDNDVVAPQTLDFIENILSQNYPIKTQQSNN